jgi:hypothetical protein
MIDLEGGWVSHFFFSFLLFISLEFLVEMCC